jgi:diguanylate cyclase (GGDEF)-like protein/PAS domain S-box-containing protein
MARFQRRFVKACAWRYRFKSSRLINTQHVRQYIRDIAGNAAPPSGIMFKKSVTEGDNGVFEPIVSKANDAIIVAEIDDAIGSGFRIVYTNETFSRIFGYSAEEAIGQSPRMLQGRETDATTIKEISATIHQGCSIRRRILNYCKNGQSIWVDVNIVPLPSHDGQIRRFAAIERDVTTEVQREHQLEELAFADPLTKLPNRRYFDRVLERELSRAQRTRQPLCLAILDIDHFKVVNDTWGHPVGDRVLIAVANALHQAVRIYDYAARIGGEEFAVVLPGAARSDGLGILDRVRQHVHATARVAVDNHTISVTCSAGLTSLAPKDTPESLTDRADRALYLAKNSGRNRVSEIGPEQPPAPHSAAASG